MHRKGTFLSFEYIALLPFFLPHARNSIESDLNEKFDFLERQFRTFSITHMLSAALPKINTPGRGTARAVSLPDTRDELFYGLRCQRD